MVRYLLSCRYRTYFIATVWLVNGLLCKVLNMEPRHEQIVARILGSEYARELTLLIGLSEIAMTVWVLSLYRSKWCAMTQIVLVTIMNILEFFLTPDLLLWGRWNAFFAFLFVIAVWCHSNSSSEPSVDS
jgi:hypothetical protein